ncbi:hypothetical protein [Limnoraphis robusta]|uniref:TNase-like domain-containing protein n=1 Tax=Limnoraphis robusta CCNP1315 TaxID=3110306 RepID=A0ABU5U6T6_9CYAN|nr:hypothetical protein [Limnoraphis robusta]MEA5522902.1 hypothetical protein [Limnoraphis robusta CCNP1315]MEA5546836.1 hypothetical protein [Limnoraphis robusta CCNP1324]
MKLQTIIQGLVVIAVLGVATAAVFFRPQSQYQTVIVSRDPDVPVSENWEIKEVIDGTTLKASRGWKARQLQLCGIEIIPGEEQQAIAYLKQLINNSNNQVAVLTVKQNIEGKWLSEVFVRLGEDSEELASALLIIKGLAVISPQVQECFYQEGLEMAEEMATPE